MTKREKLIVEEATKDIPQRSKDYWLATNKKHCTECYKRSTKLFFSAINSKEDIHVFNVRLLCSLCYSEYHFDTAKTYYLFESDFILQGNHDQVCTR